MRRIKKDTFYRSRGGVCQIWQISCTSCNHEVLIYQKDGHGSLMRAYLNRILAPESLAALQDTALSTKELDNLICGSCKIMLGTPMLHWEGRLAYRLVPGAWRKKQLHGAASAR